MITFDLLGCKVPPSIYRMIHALQEVSVLVDDDTRSAEEEIEVILSKYRIYELLEVLE